ncbi:unnamed protein product [Linum tenue]|uniref:Uncharacterized protein n=1 Tax=Linum tenue TaxID=586396 RepID=A0AAV0HZX4_9ROSI|nr:unnamed protein product [Linum tenue]
MSSICLSACSTSRPLAVPPCSAAARAYSSTAGKGCQCSLSFRPANGSGRLLSSAGDRGRLQVVRMAPDEEKLTRRNPLDFPIEWERPKPGRRPDIFPQFSPMKTPIPPPLPYDPPPEEEEEEDGDKKKEEEEEGDENPDKEEEPEKPDI